MKQAKGQLSACGLEKCEVARRTSIPQNATYYEVCLRVPCEEWNKDHQPGFAFRVVRMVGQKSGPGHVRNSCSKECAG